MRSERPDPRPELEPAEFDRWWEQTGAREMRQILYWRWDPIGVADVSFPATWDEYDRYAPQVASMANKKASAQEIADYLHSVESGSITLTTSDQHRAYVAQLVLTWFFESIDRWQEGLPSE